MADLHVLSDAEFEQIRELVYRSFGINLTDQKRALVVGRLNKVLREEKFSTFSDYYNYVIKDESGKALSVLVDRISTNHTFFNREADHFAFFREEALPDWIDRLRSKGRKKIRIWVAGCSSGEESYMLAMLFREVLGNNISSWDVGILATDISVTALEKAIAARYTAENVEHMPPAMKNKYFKKQADGTWQVRDDVRSMVTHRKLNLMRDSFPFKNSFQMVFCRNVMIYFDRPTRDALVTRFHRYMDPGGYLFIGHSETLGRSNELFRYLRPALYQKGEA